MANEKFSKSSGRICLTAANSFHSRYSRSLEAWDAGLHQEYQRVDRA
jgi:hypothetical protein